MDIIVVNDTNVLIDLYSIDLLEAFFRLPLQVHTTDFVLNELVKDDQRKEVEKFCAKWMFDCETTYGRGTVKYNPFPAETR